MSTEDRQKLAAEIDEVSRQLFNLSRRVEQLALRLYPLRREPKEPPFEGVEVEDYER